MRLAVALLLISFTFAVTGCKSDPNTPEYWEKRISNGKGAKGKEKAVEALRASEHMGPAMLPVLTKHLDSERSPEVKASIARLLGEKGDASVVEPLIAAIDPGATDSSSHRLNREILIALGHLKDPRAIPTVVRMLGSKDSFTMVDAIEAAGELKAKEAVDPLLKIVESTDRNMNFPIKKAIIALGDIGDPRAIPELIKRMYQEQGVSFYVEASYALYQLGKPAADALLPVLEGKDKELVDWANQNNIKPIALPLKAAQCLGDLGDERAEKTLVGLLGYKSEFDDIRLLVRMRAADALGRMRSKEAGKVLAGMLDEPEPTARHEYIWALVRIGYHDAVPKLIEAAGQGTWDAREEAMIGVARLGEGGDLGAFDKFAANEQKLTEAQCKEYPDDPPCKDVAASVKKHLARIDELKKSVAAAKECKGDAACWAKKLDDADQGVRERAAYEVGRSDKAVLIGELTKRLGEKNLDARLAFIQGALWLVRDSKEARSAAQAAVPAIEKQIADERGKTEFVKVNEDLRRLLVTLQRTT